MAGVNIKINFNSIASQNFGNQIWRWEKKWKVSTFRAFDPSILTLCESLTNELDFKFNLQKKNKKLVDNL